MNRPFRLLVRHFLRRFLDNDLVSPNADNHANTALFLAFLVVPNLLGCVLLVLKYGHRWITLSQRLLMGLDDKLAFLCTSMILTALVTVVEWDALWLDERDNAILRPLPIRATTLVGAKLAALAMFVGVVAGLVNAVPAVLFPVVWLTTMPVGLGVVVRLIAVHALVSLGSAVFALATVLAIRGLLMTMLPARALRVASNTVQFSAIFLLVCAFLVSPAFYHSVDKTLSSGSRLGQAAPPMWFLGLYERMSVGVVLGQPAEVPALEQRTWMEREEARRNTYVAIAPAFALLARRAVIGMSTMFALAAGLLTVGNLRRAGHELRAVTTGRRRRWSRRVAAASVGLAAGRHAVSRATFVFTLKTLARSARHRLYVAGFLAGGIALVVASQGPRVLRNMAVPIGQLTSPDPGLLVLQLVLAFSLILGLRAGFPVPAELRANWIFRVTEQADVRAALAGVRRAFRSVAVGFLAVLVPWHAAIWGWLVAAQHFVVGALVSLLLVDCVLISFPKLPFTVPYVPGRSRLRYTWPVYLFFFWVFTSLAAFFEFHALQSARGFGTFAACLVLMLVSIAWVRRLNHRHLVGFAFDEEEERTIQTLDLMP